DARAINNAREDIAAKLIGAEPMSRARGLQSVRQLNVSRILRSDPWRKERKADKQRDENEADCCQLLLSQQPHQVDNTPDCCSTKCEYPPNPLKTSQIQILTTILQSAIFISQFVII